MVRASRHSVPMPSRSSTWSRGIARA
jgi:hypothetical protein